MHKLLLKTHTKTGLKYLCYTTTKDHEKYLGSGVEWKKHLKEHGEQITTMVLFESDSYSDLVERARQYSEMWKVQSSSQFANLRPETGQGGDTVSNKRWITDGTKSLYINKEDPVPDGFRYGRMCIFSDSGKQSEFGQRARKNDTPERIKARGAKISLKKKGVKNPKLLGENNPTKRPEVAEKISNSRSSKWKITYTNGNVEIVSNLFAFSKRRNLWARYDKKTKKYIHSMFIAEKIDDSCKSD